MNFLRFVIQKSLVNLIDISLMIWCYEWVRFFSPFNSILIRFVFFKDQNEDEKLNETEFVVNPGKTTRKRKEKCRFVCLSVDDFRERFRRSK